MAGSALREGAPIIDRLDPRLLTGEPTYIFNTYSNSHTQNLGTVGLYYIPPCPEGQDWVRGPVIPGTVEENYPHYTDREEYRSRALVGDDVAKLVLGIGPGQRPDEDLRRYGVLASKHSQPSKPEFQEARKLLIKELQAQVAEADKFFTAADPLVRDSINEKHYRAARYLNIKRDWMSEASAMTTCPFCASAVNPNASVCPKCNQVINKVAFEAMQKQIAGA